MLGDVERERWILKVGDGQRVVHSEASATSLHSVTRPQISLLSSAFSVHFRMFTGLPGRAPPWVRARFALLVGHPLI